MVWPGLFHNTALFLDWKSRSGLFLYLESEWPIVYSKVPEAKHCTCGFLDTQPVLTLSETIDKLEQVMGSGRFMLAYDMLSLVRIICFIELGL